jgi:uncharacterized protein YdaU (DUF1376 family)
MSKAPAFQFYVKDWLSSADVQVMTPAQEGAYIRLLAYCWDSGDCSLPDDDAQLAVLSRLNEGWFNGGSTTIRRKFHQHPTKTGYLTNDRLLKEAAKQDKWSRKSSAGGRASAAKRAEKKRKSKGGSKVVDDCLEPKGNSSSSSSSSNNNPIVPLPDWIPKRDWSDWIAQRPKKPTPRAIELAISKLAELREGGIPPESVLQHCIMNGYQGIFPPKSTNAPKPQRQKQPISNVVTL